MPIPASRKLTADRPDTRQIFMTRRAIGKMAPEFNHAQETSRMGTTQIFFSNLIAILGSRGLSLAWIEEKTGINEAFLSTFEWIASGLSFQLVIKVALALGVSIGSLISEEGIAEDVVYGRSDPKEAYMDIYGHFWMSVDYEADKQGMDLYDIAHAAGMTIAGIVSCAAIGRDMDVQRAEAIALMLDTSLDKLIWEQLPGYPYEDDVFDDSFAVNF